MSSNYPCKYSVQCSATLNVLILKIKVLIKDKWNKKILSAGTIHSIPEALFH